MNDSLQNAEELLSSVSPSPNIGSPCPLRGPLPLAGELNFLIGLPFTSMCGLRKVIFNLLSDPQSFPLCRGT